MRALAMVALAGLVAGCAGKDDIRTAVSDPAGLVAHLRSPSSAATGSVRVVDSRDGVSVQLAVSNLVPGQHRIAFHENGNCSSFNLFSAGPAWAPPGATRPATDLMSGFLANQEGNQNGYVAYVPGVRAESLRGRSVVIHWGNLVGEAFPGQPNNRVACGVLQSATPIL